MKSPENNGLLIISGPSGAGKTTLSHALIAAVPDTLIAVSHTTRSPRGNEKNGIDYFFVSKDEFQELIDNGEMVEYAEVYGNFYGTSRNSIEKPLREGKNIILDIDWQGARRVKSLFPEAVSVYILPPADREAQKRLQLRQQDTDDTIDARMSSYQEQMSHSHEYDHQLINDDLAEAIQQLLKIAPFS